MQVLFPDVSIHDLSFVNFARRVLLPETAVLLTQDDLGISREQAVNVFLASRQYGMTMHPQDDSNDGEEYYVELNKKRAKLWGKVKMEETDTDLVTEKIVNNTSIDFHTVIEDGKEVILLD